MKTTRVKFDDLRGMLNADEIRGIIGGCGLNPYGTQSGATYTNNYTTSDPLTTFLNNLNSTYVSGGTMQTLDVNSISYRAYLLERETGGKWSLDENGNMYLNGAYRDDVYGGSGYGTPYTGSSLNGSAELNYLTSFKAFNDWVNSEHNLSTITSNNLAFFASMANWNAGKYINIGNDTFIKVSTQDPTIDICQIPKRGGSISVGSITATGVSQLMELGSGGILNTIAGYIQEGVGITQFTQETKGGIGIEKNSDGQWVAMAGFTVTPPSSFTNAGAAGNVEIYINGNYVSTFGLSNHRNTSNGPIIYATGTLDASGKMNLPSWFDGTQKVEFRVSVGSTSHDGAGMLLANINQSASATITVPTIR